MNTPVRRALRGDSGLQEHVRDGVQAIERKHLTALIDDGIRSAFSDSLDLDKALEPEHPQDHRWDYLLGHDASGCVVGLEPHSAYQGHISRVIAKRAHALRQLEPHLRDGARVAAWYWVASGQVGFLRHEKAMLQIQQAGITFVGRQLLAKHLPSAPVAMRPAKGGKSSGKPVTRKPRRSRR